MSRQGIAISAGRVKMGLFSRLWGRLKNGRSALADRYVVRLQKAGRGAGLTTSKPSESRTADGGGRPPAAGRSNRLANVIPDGAVTVVLDPKGENLNSEAIAGENFARGETGAPSRGLCDRRAGWARRGV